MAVLQIDNLVSIRDGKKQRKKRAHNVQRLPPLNLIEFPEPGSGKETINQRRLREFHQIEAEYFEARRLYKDALKSIQDLILHGAAIQNGHWKVKPKTSLRRHPRYRQALIDYVDRFGKGRGEAYQQRVLNNTPPTMHWTVTVA